MMTVPTDARLYAYIEQGSQPYVLPPIGQPPKMRGEKILWVLQADSAQMHTTQGGYTVREQKITFDAPVLTRNFVGVPHCDFFGQKFHFGFPDGDELAETLAHFYWHCLLPQVAERTVMRRRIKLREGYVLSTLDTQFYGGTYPCVDHEFHIRGRLAMRSALDLAVVRRMIALQLRVMETDPKGLYRSVCSVQPRGKREYLVTRRSRDHREKAVMFRLTGNIELIEEVYGYYCATKDADFLARCLPTLEKSAAYIASFLQPNDLIDSQVYYEDQVMKDGAVAQAQAFAAQALDRLAELCACAGQEGEDYRALAARLREAYVRDVPRGFWHPKTQRYVDWIDRQGRVHDHVHLLANALPVLFGFNPPERDAQINDTIAQHDNIFQKFPSFVAAKIEDYSESELGTGGPYDLCAAGRYWCHDAKYRAHIGQHERIKAQLLQVARQAQADHYQMGERYDMNYVYYQDDKNWHGAARYYEYPCVFADVLIHDYLGVRAAVDADIALAPQLPQGTVTLEAWGIRYTVADGALTVHNIASHPLTVRVGDVIQKIQPNGMWTFGR
ncbi:MAG: hypothetical protein LBN05_08725 [Oscillospiraceae bacterium]|jgi:hypothetical protein|nr:hypothetical protein [Oscillospiraceae bacterium]